MKILLLYPDIPWKAVKGIRDRIAHGYFEIDADLIFETVKENLPSLLEATRFFIRKITFDKETRNIGRSLMENK